MPAFIERFNGLGWSKRPQAPKTRGRRSRRVGELKVKLPAELYNSPGRGGEDLAEGGLIDIARHAVASRPDGNGSELRVIKEIESFQAELEESLFVLIEIHSLGKCQVGVVYSRSMKVVPACIA